MTLVPSIAEAEAILVTFLWSTSYVLIKLGLPQTPPVGFAVTSQRGIMKKNAQVDGPRYPSGMCTNLSLCKPYLSINAIAPGITMQ